MLFVEEPSDGGGIESDRVSRGQRVDRPEEQAFAQPAPLECGIDEHHRNPAELAVGNADARGDERVARHCTEAGAGRHLDGGAPVFLALIPAGLRAQAMRPRNVARREPAESYVG